MGIRIHKALGYGLTDLVCEKYTIKDDRINPEGILGDDRHESERWTREKYLEYLQVKAEEHERLHKEYQADNNLPYPEDFDALIELDGLKGKNRWSPSDSVLFCGEFGLSNVLCIVPSCYTHEWVRYDDSIDYAEEVGCHRGIVNRVEVFDDGFFPYSGVSMDARTGTPFSGENYHFAQHFFFLKRFLEDLDKGRSNLKEGVTIESLREKMDKIVVHLGFQDFEEANKYVAPLIPRPVQYFCRFAEIFKEESTIWQLRPMLYVYWS